MAKSIWKILGIKKTTDIGEIKRAYAAKLKNTRPEDDPSAFQALRSAREQAEGWARHEKYRAEEKQTELIAKEIEAAEEDEFPAENSKQKSAHNVEIKDEFDPTVDDKVEILGDSDGPAINTPDEVLADWFEGRASEIDLLERHETFKYLRGLSFESREHAERRIISAIAANFEFRTEQQSEEDTKFTPPSNSFADETILKLCEEFGWFDNDRRLSELVFWDHEKLADQLRNLKHYGSVTYRPRAINPPSQWSGSYWWIWMIIAFVILRLISSGFR